MIWLLGRLINLCTPASRQSNSSIRFCESTFYFYMVLHQMVHNRFVGDASEAEFTQIMKPVTLHSPESHMHLTWATGDSFLHLTCLLESSLACPSLQWYSFTLCCVVTQCATFERAFITSRWASLEVRHKVTKYMKSISGQCWSTLKIKQTALHHPNIKFNQTRIHNKTSSVKATLKECRKSCCTQLYGTHGWSF